MLWLGVEWGEGVRGALLGRFFGGHSFWGRGVGTAKGSFEVTNRLGLHARAAAQLVKLASQYPCEIVAKRDGQAANAKSVMGVLLLCGARGTVLEFEATGEQAEEAIRDIGALFENRFGERD